MDLDWARILSGIGSGLQQAGGPQGWSGFGPGLQQGVQGYDARLDAQAEREFRDLQMQMARDKAEAERTAAQDAQKQRERASAALAAMFGQGGDINQGPMSPAPMPDSPLPPQHRSIGQGPMAQAQGVAPGIASGPMNGGALSGYTPDQMALIRFGMETDPIGTLEFVRQQAFEKPKDNSTDDQREYELAKSQGFEGTFLDFVLAQKKAGASTTTVNNNIGGENSADAKMREELSKEEGKRWSELQNSGLVSSSLAQDFQALDELMTVAPQGPITGRLAEVFPGFSSAGDAFQSVVKRVAPSLRVPGSGATSDIEYEGMLQSLPRLSTSPEGNKAIAEMMKAKAQLNIQRAEIISRYQNEEVSAKEARRQLAAINAASIMTPALRTALQGTGVAPSGSGGPQGAASKPSAPRVLNYDKQGNLVP